ncbi:hypothetical protein [Psychrobacter pygoscelis]|uniref:hypothetical protein n=1 Tax=Psychrobacter pygoscelis TaxID=2488563 RepID=UPI00103FB711|nr:hypothetical protein [Psychrobacter pygoscelis]
MNKIFTNIAILGMATLGLQGCQVAKSSLNLLTDNMYVAQLPEKTSTKLQVVTGWGGSFNATPNSDRYRSSTKLGTGVLSMHGSSKSTRLPIQGFNDKEMRLIFDNDLNLPKPTDREQRLYQSAVGSTVDVTVTERYITPDQPFSVYFRGNDAFNACSVTGTFTPKANSNYRLTGMFGSKCLVILERFVKNSRGETTLETIKFDN